MKIGGFLLPLAVTVALADPAVSATGASWLNLPLSACQLGRGNVSSFGGDVLSSWSNPAILTRQVRPLELSAGGSADPGPAGTHGGLGVGYAIAPEWRVGALVSYMSSDLSEVNEDGIQTGKKYGSTFIATALLGAARFGPVGAGITAKYVSDDVLGDKSAGVALDAGISADLQDATFACSIRNLGPSIRKKQEYAPEETLPVETRIGAGYEARVQRLSGGLEYRMVAERGGFLGAGLEWQPMAWLAVRAGVNDIFKAAEQPTAGLSLFSGRISFSYAMGMNELGIRHQAVLSLFLSPVSLVTESVAAPAYAVDPEVEYQASLQLYGGGNYDAALVRAEKALAANPSYWQAWQMAGNCRYAKGDMAGATAAYEKSLSTNPDNPQLRAFADQVKAASPAPAAASNPDTDYQESVALYGAGQYDAALAKAGSAVRANQSHWQAWQMVGNCLYAKGDTAGALKAYRYSLVLNPDNPQLKAFVESVGAR